MMPRRALIAGILLAGLAHSDGALAGGPAGLFLHGTFSGSQAAVAAGVYGGLAMSLGGAGAPYGGMGWRDDPALLIVDATPPAAQVYLDGRRLGAASELVALALPVSHGSHAIHVIAPGFRPWVAQFVADGSFPIRIRATLTPE